MNILICYHKKNSCHTLDERSEEQTIGKRKGRESDERSDGSKTDPDMPELSDEEESDDDIPRKVDLVDNESDDKELEQSEEPRPTPIVERSPERDANEGRSPKRTFIRGIRTGTDLSASKITRPS